MGCPGGECAAEASELPRLRVWEWTSRLRQQRPGYGSLLAQRVGDTFNQLPRRSSSSLRTNCLIAAPSHVSSTPDVALGIGSQAANSFWENVLERLAPYGFRHIEAILKLPLAVGSSVCSNLSTMITPTELPNNKRPTGGSGRLAGFLVTACVFFAGYCMGANNTAMGAKSLLEKQVSGGGG